MKKIPPKIRDEIKKAVSLKADAHGYMHRDRIENGVFMDNLVKDAGIGGKLSEYMNKSELKTYIKDGILNRYAKDKTSLELSTNSSGLIKRIYSQESELIEEGNGKDSRLSLHRLDSGDLLIVVGGTLLKWETALRKALDFIARAPGLPPEESKLNVLVVLATGGRNLTDGDSKLLHDALGFIGVKVVLI